MGPASVAAMDGDHLRGFSSFIDTEINDGFVDVWTTTSGAGFYANASVIDAGTGDPMTVLPR